LVAAAATAALLASCGGERSAQEVARTYVASDDPGKCDDAALPFLERQSRRRGEAARKACREAVERARPLRDVRVTGRSVGGDRAEVRLEASGQEVTVRLARTEGRWLVTGFGR